MWKYPGRLNQLIIYLATILSLLTLHSCRHQSSTALSLAITYHDDHQEITLISNSTEQSSQSSRLVRQILVRQILGTKPVYSLAAQPSLLDDQTKQTDQQNQQKLLLTRLISAVVLSLIMLAMLAKIWSQRQKIIIDLHTEQAKLQQQQAFLAKTITSALITLDEKYLIQKINRATSITFAYAEAELLGKNIDLLIPGFTEYLASHLQPSTDGVNHPFAQIGGNNSLQAINQQQQTFPIELTVTYWQEKNTTFYLLVINSKQAESLMVQTLKAEHQELENIVTNQQNEFNQLTEELLKEVAERHQTQRELQQTKEQLEVILQGISDGITVLNQKGEIVYVNQAAKRASNYTSLLVQNFQQFPLSHGHNYVEITNEKGEIHSPDTLPHHLALLGQEVAETVLCYNFWQGDRSYEIVKATPILREEKVSLVIIVTHDITARKQVEEALRASEERYRRMVETAGEGIWIIDADYKTTFVNSRTAGMLGYKVEEIMGRSILDFTDEEGRKIAQEKVANGHKGRPEQLDLKLICGDGRELWVIISTTPTFDATDQYIGAVGMMTDITERKLAEEKIQALAERLQVVIETVDEGLTLSNEYGYFEIFNSKMVEITGYTKDEANHLPEQLLLEQARSGEIHPTQIDFLSLLYPNTQSRLQAIAGMSKLLQDGRVQNMETSIVAKDGTIKTLLISSALIMDVETNKYWFLSAYRDISDRVRAFDALRNSEAQYRVLVEQMPAATYKFLIDGSKSLYISPQIEEMTGYSQGEWMKRANLWYEMMPIEDCSRVKAKIAESLQNQDEFLVVEYRLRHRQGNILWIRDQIAIVTDENDQPLFLQGIMLNISDSKATEELLSEQKRFIQKIADASPSILYLYDLKQKSIIYMNRSIGKMLGYTTEEIEQLGEDCLNTLIHPEDLHKMSIHRQSFDLANDGDIATFEYRVKAANGEWRWFMSRDTIFTRGGDRQPLQILGTMADISQQKRVEMSLQEANQQLQCWVNELEERQQEMFWLAEISEFLQACLTVEEAHQALANLLKPLFPGCSGGVFMISDTGNLMESVATWGDNFNSETIFHPNQCWGLRRGIAHMVESHHLNLSCQHINAPSAESLCMPMLAQGNILGMLYLSSIETGLLSPAKKQLAHNVSEQISLALANLRLRETLQNQSMRDPLTSLFNRRYMQEFLEQELHRAVRSNYSVGLIMLDIDHFKNFNDSYGHEAGDLVLQEISKFLQKNIRSSDAACRYGGEELIVILPQANLYQSKQRAEMIRKGIKKLDLRSQNLSLGSITVSIGVVCFPDHGMTTNSLLQAVDQMLYQAKAEGRDRVVAMETSEVS